MRRFRRILVAIEAAKTEAPPSSLVRAAELAKGTGAVLVVVMTVSKLEFTDQVMRLLGGKSSAALADEHYEIALQNACKQARLDELGVSFETKLLRGRPFRQVILELQRSQCDMVILDSSGPSNSSFFGPLENRLMRNCPCPLWVQKAGSDGEFDCILAAIDPQPETSKEEALNKRIIDLAASLAEWENAKLYVAAAWHVRGDALLRSRMSHDMFQRHVLDTANAAKEYFRQVTKASPVTIAAENANLELGDPSEVILESVAALKPDVIVMGTLARAGVSGMLIGNTAESVLSSVSTSVITLKPGDFVSPIGAD